MREFRQKLGCMVLLLLAALMRGHLDARLWRIPLRLDLCLVEEIQLSICNLGQDSRCPFVEQQEPRLIPEQALDTVLATAAEQEERWLMRIQEDGLVHFNETKCTSSCDMDSGGSGSAGVDSAGGSTVSCATSTDVAGVFGALVSCSTFDGFSGSDEGDNVSTTSAYCTLLARSSFWMTFCQ